MHGKVDSGIQRAASDASSQVSSMTSNPASAAGDMLHCAAHDTVCLAWCLMDYLVHLILVPATQDGLRASLGEAHRRYSHRVNFRQGWRGYLFQARNWRSKPRGFF
jgi:hypothetical protein